MIKIIMHGCNGKMGQVITKIAEADSKVENCSRSGSVSGSAESVSGVFIDGSV